MRAFPAAVALVLTGACAPRAVTGGSRMEEFVTGTAKFRVVYSGEDRDAARDVRRALERAVPRVERWGGLRFPVTVTIHATHEALEAVVDRRGYEWLHAWARFESIDLQSPRTWTDRPSARELDALATHELTHCAMYQLAGGDMTWMYKEIPRWFSEGLATFTAGQGDRYAGLEDLHRFYTAPRAADAPGESAVAGALARRGDPVVDPDPLYQNQWWIVYGAGHRATEFLVARYGERRVLELLRAMGTGLRFPAAFRRVIGITDAEFAADFRRYVIWGGWRKD